MKRKFKLTVLVTFTIIYFFNFLFANSLKQNSPVNATITSIADDGENIWIGSNNGLWKIKKKNNHINHFTMSNSELPSNYISCLCVRANGHVWIGTPRGIMIYDLYSYYVINDENTDLPENIVTSMVSDANDDVWIGTYSKGLVRVHNLKFKVFNTSNSLLPSNNILSVNTDDNRNIWVGLKNEGILKIKDNHFTKFDSKNGFDGKNVRIITQISKDKYFLYDYNGDVYSYNNSSFKKLDSGFVNINLLQNISVAGRNNLVYYNVEGSMETSKKFNDFQNTISCLNLLLPKEITNNISCSEKGLIISLYPKETIVANK